MSFNSETPTSWNILFKVDDLTSKSTKDLLDKITNFAKERTIEKLTVSSDIYTLESNFFVIHGIKSVESATGIAHVLKEYKDYKIADLAIIISSENYKVVQVKKNIDEYTSGDWLKKPIVLIQRNIALPEDKTTIKKTVLEKANQPEQNPNYSKNQVIKAKQNMDAPQNNIDPSDNNLNSANPKSANPGFPKKP